MLALSLTNSFDLKTKMLPHSRCNSLRPDLFMIFSQIHYILAGDNFGLFKNSVFELIGLLAHASYGSGTPKSSRRYFSDIFEKNVDSHA